MGKICYRWESANVNWENASWTWGDCALVQDLIGFFNGVDASQLVPTHKTPWGDKQKKKRLLKLIAKVKGVDFSEEELVSENVRISIEDVAMVIKAVSGINVDVSEVRLVENDTNYKLTVEEPRLI